MDDEDEHGVDVDDHELVYDKGEDVLHEVDCNHHNDVLWVSCGDNLEDEVHEDYDVDHEGILEGEEGVVPP